MKAASYDVVVVGGIFREVFWRDHARRVRVRGSGATAAIVSGRLGGKCALVSYVGVEDAESVLSLLEAASVDVSAVEVLDGASGTFAYSPLDDGTNPWPSYRPAERTPVETPLMPTARVYVVFGIPDFDPAASGWLDDLPADSLLLWDRQGWMSRARDSALILPLNPSRKIYVANRSEACDELDLPDHADCLSLMPPDGFSEALIKLGSSGVAAISRSSAESPQIVEGFPVEVEDSVGSGDVFAGAAATILSRDEPLDRAAVIGNAAASAYLRLGSDPLDELFPQLVADLVASSE